MVMTATVPKRASHSGSCRYEACKKAHGPLGHVKDLRCLEDEDKPEGHQGIHDAHHKPRNQYFNEKSHMLLLCFLNA
jgi:hypothetical protein